MANLHRAQNVGMARVEFIHTLRGVAPLLVMWAHLGGWWLFVRGQTSILQTFWIDKVNAPLHLWQDGGHLGVLIFFLVSGFIITHVSMTETRVAFATKRFFRLMPPFWAVLVLIAALSALANALSLPPMLGPQSHRLGDYLGTAMLWNWAIGEPVALSVGWSLFIEVLFYALTFLFMGFSRASPLRATWGMLAAMALVYMLMFRAPVFIPFLFGWMYIPFLLIGRAFYLGWSRKCAPWHTFAVGAFSYGLFVLMFNNISPGRLFAEGVEALWSHFWAIGVFAALCGAAHFKTPRPLGFVADISYSLYLLHIPLGSFVLDIALKAGVPFELSILPTIATVLCASWAMFAFIEKPFQRLARSIGRPSRRAVLSPSLAQT
jgi:peptidoglycan/LPS O-acetylase OafA/YrhL